MRACDCLQQPCGSLETGQPTTPLKTVPITGDTPPFLPRKEFESFLSKTKTGHSSGVRYQCHFMGSRGGEGRCGLLLLSRLTFCTELILRPLSIPGTNFSFPVASKPLYQAPPAGTSGSQLMTRVFLSNLRKTGEVLQKSKPK